MITDITSEIVTPHVSTALVSRVSTKVSTSVQTSSLVPSEKKLAVKVIHLCDYLVTVKEPEDKIIKVAYSSSEDHIEGTEIWLATPKSCDTKKANAKLERLNRKRPGASRQSSQDRSEG